MTELAITDRGPTESDKGYGDGEEAFLARAVKRFARVENAESLNRTQALEDLQFKAGDQWPQDIRSQRTIDKRPCLTINKMKTFVHQITNDQRQNRPAINVSPVGDKSDIETARMLKGMIRQIERQSNADVAYDTAFDSAVSAGWGYWRIITEYESEDTFDQVIKVERIRNPFRVYIDPDHQQPDGSDAKWVFITDLLTHDEFKAQFPGKKNPFEWNEGTVGDEWKHWGTETHVRIAEYFCFEPYKRKLLALANGHIGFEDELDESLKDLISESPDIVLKEREVEANKIYWYKITSKEILDKREWVGKWIPIVKVIGDEADIEGKVSYAGLVRDAKDPQRMYNFWCTSETELIALAPKAPWIMEEGQIEGHEQRWKEANVKALPYLLYRGVSVAGKPAPAPERQQFQGPPAGVVQAKIGAAQDMQAVTGIRFDATLQERTYDESGKALSELKRVGDIMNFHYVDNLSRSLKHTGRIMIDLIPKIYDTKRVITILRDDDSEQTVTIDPGMQKSNDKQDINGKVMRLYNPNVGRYEVAVTVGPNFATKRAESADSMINFLKVLPNSAPLIADLIAKEMDWPRSQEVAERLEAMLPPQIQEKNIENLPPEAKGIVNSLHQQMQQLKQERDQAVSLLGDKDKDRAIQMEKINKDYEAKLHDISAGMQETIIKTLATMKQGNEAEFEKIARDSELRMQEMLMNERLENQRMRMEAQQAQQDRDSQNQQANADRSSQIQQKLAELSVQQQQAVEERKLQASQGNADRQLQETQGNADRQLQTTQGNADRSLKSKQGAAELETKETIVDKQQDSKITVLQKEIKDLKEQLKDKVVEVTGPSGKKYTKKTTYKGKK